MINSSSGEVEVDQNFKPILSYVGHLRPGVDSQWWSRRREQHSGGSTHLYSSTWKAEAGGSRPPWSTGSSRTARATQSNCLGRGGWLGGGGGDRRTVHQNIF